MPSIFLTIEHGDLVAIVTTNGCEARHVVNTYEAVLNLRLTYPDADILRSSSLDFPTEYTRSATVLATVEQLNGGAE